jgi:hypothetical protein
VAYLGEVSLDGPLGRSVEPTGLGHHSGVMPGQPSPVRLVTFVRATHVAPGMVALSHTLGAARALLRSRHAVGIRSFAAPTRCAVLLLNLSPVRGLVVGEFR